MYCEEPCSIQCILIYRSIQSFCVTDFVSKSDGNFTDALAVETLLVTLETRVRIQQMIFLAHAGLFLFFTMADDTLL